MNFQKIWLIATDFWPTGKHCNIMCVHLAWFWKWCMKSCCSILEHCTCSQSKQLIVRACVEIKHYLREEQIIFSDVGHNGIVQLIWTQFGIYVSACFLHIFSFVLCCVYVNVLYWLLFDWMEKWDIAFIHTYTMNNDWICPRMTNYVLYN